MKKLIAILFFIIALTINSYSIPWTGSGSSSSPYRITSELDLIALINANDNTIWSKYFVLTNDIYCSSNYTAFIGNNSNTFTGSFDGQDHFIFNLSYNTNTDYCGLFGLTSSATISNLHIYNASITNNSSSTYTTATGCLIGASIDTYIINCSAAGTVVSNNTSILEGTGGLVGLTGNGFIENCYSTGSVEISSISTSGYLSCAGGLIGFNSSMVTHCFSNCNVTTNNIANNNISIGGFAGYNNGSIYTSYSTGNINVNNTLATNESDIGGFLGDNGDNVGHGTVNNCYSTGNISGSIADGAIFLGGFFGYEYSPELKTNCYSTGAISVSSSSGTITQGGFTGYISTMSGTYTCCYWNTQTSSLPNAYGRGYSLGISGLTTVQMQSSTIFTTCGWLNTVWDFVSGEFPDLKNMPIIRAPNTPVFNDWFRVMLILSVVLIGSYFVYRKIYI